MAVNPSPRTHPTVKPLATMNKKNLQQWELRLGVAQVVVLLGMVTGSIACAFYVGFSSGRGVGFEAALERSLAHSPRFPVAEGEGNSASHNETDVYARLSAPVPALASSRKEEPILGAIKSTEVAPLGDEVAVKEQAPLQPKTVESSETAGLDMDSLFPIEPSVEEPSKFAKNLGEIAPQPKQERSASVNRPETIQAAKKTDTGIAKVELKELKPSQKVAEKPAAIVKPATKKTEVAKVANAAPEKPAIAAKAADKSLVRQTLPAGWFAQIAAPRKMQDASALASKLKSSGFPVLIESARVRGEEYFRVIVGPEQNKQQAERLIGQLKRESYVQGDPFLRVVK